MADKPQVKDSDLSGAKGHLKKTTTKESNSLPTKADIAAEKAAGK